MDLYLQQECRKIIQSQRHLFDTQALLDAKQEIEQTRSDRKVTLQEGKIRKRVTVAEIESSLVKISTLQRETDLMRRENEKLKREFDAEKDNSLKEKQHLENEIGGLRVHSTEQERQKQQIESANQNIHERLAASQVESGILQRQITVLSERLAASLSESAELQERLVAALGELHRHSQRDPEAVDITPWNVPRSDVHTSPEEIGRGGWGVVLRGTYEGETVAVKQPHRDLLNQRLLERLKRETRLMIQISHPNLVRIIAVVFDEAAERLRRPPLIVTELLDINLRQCYQERRLQPRNRVPVFLDVARGLHYMHDRTEPIIHRDVSAPNVLLKALPNGRWRAKVSDFGSANLARLSVTAGEGAIIYTPPEAFPPRSPDSPRPRHTTKIDVYSFGILVCEVVTAEQPDPELYQERLGQVERLSRPLHSLVVRCTDHDPDKRPTMATVIQELSNISLPEVQA